MKKIILIASIFLFFTSCSSLIDFGHLGDVEKYEITPTNQYVVYISDEDTGVLGLYSANLSSGSVIKLSSDTTNKQLDVTDFKISPDGSTVVFMGDMEKDGVVRLYSVSVSGGEIKTLSHHEELNSDLDVQDFAISPDSSIVVFKGDTEVDAHINLYSVNIAGGDITKLSEKVSVDGVLGTHIYEISPDSTKVVFRSDRDFPNAVVRLYSVDIHGGDITTLSNNLTDDATLDVTENFAISPDSTTVVFIGDTEIDAFYSLYSVSINGGEVIKLSSSLVASTNTVVGLFRINNTSSQVAFGLYNSSSEKFSLYLAPINQEAPVLLVGDLEDYLANFAFSEDNQSLVWRTFTDLHQVNLETMEDIILLSSSSLLVCDSFHEIYCLTTEETGGDYSLYFSSDESEAPIFLFNAPSSEFKVVETSDGVKIFYEEENVFYVYTVETGEKNKIWESEEVSIDDYLLSSDGKYIVVYGSLGEREKKCDGDFCIEFPHVKLFRIDVEAGIEVSISR